MDPNTAAKIARALTAPAGAAVVEIGPGTGALTGLLLGRFPQLVALEIDPRAVAYLKAVHPDLDVRQADALKFDWPGLVQSSRGPLHVIGNLPYNITSPILFRLFRHRHALAEAVFMMQREVAERLVALPKTKAYGIPSVLAQLYARPRLLFRVPRSVLRPKPAVESAVIALAFDLAREPEVEHGLLRTVVRAAFGQRRKVLRNSLHGIVAELEKELPEQWARMRAEELSPACFVELVRYFQGAASIS